MAARAVVAWVAVAVLATVVGAVSWARPAYSASSITFNVNDTVDRVDAIPGNSQCRSAEGTCTLRAAIQESRALVVAGQASNAIINVPAGVYTLTLVGAGEQLNATGDLDITTPTTIRGDGIGLTVIDGIGSDRIFEVSSTVDIANLTLRNGNTSGAQVSGGLILNTGSGVLTVSNVHLLSQGFFNGALRNDGTASLTNVQILNPTGQPIAVEGGLGGGIMNAGTLDLTDTLVSGQYVVGDGGGIANSGRLTMLRGSVRGNVARGTASPFLPHVGTPARGGGIFNTGAIFLDGVTVDTNDAREGTGAEGGGIYSVGRVLIQNSTISNNTATGGCTLTAGPNNSSIPKRNVVTGGGLRAFDGRMVNSTIAGNSIVSTDNCDGAPILMAGAGLSTGASGLTVALVNVTISNNAVTTPNGGDAILGRGVYVWEGGLPVTVQNVIVQSSPGGSTCYGPIQSLGGNLASDGSCGFSGPDDQANVDPRLVAMTNNEGPTHTFALQPGSPAIDRGHPTACPPTDQRGVRRPRNGDGANGERCDVGSFEAAGALGLGRVFGDFDGDRYADVGVFRPSDGNWFVRHFTESVSIVQWGASGDLPVLGDFDGDGKTDHALYRPSEANWYVKFASGGDTVMPWGSPGSLDTPVPADFDGDGKTDFVVYRPSNASWYIRYAAGGFSVVPFGLSTQRDLPVPGDYDGDGKADQAVYRVSERNWYIFKSSGGVVVVNWGHTNDVPVPADYNGDGQTDIAVFRPSEGAWYIHYQPGIFSVVTWGLPNAGDVPVPADYDSDGRADIAIYRPSEANWYLRRSLAGAGVLNWGNAGSADIPVVRKLAEVPSGGGSAATTSAGARRPATAAVPQNGPVRPTALDPSDQPCNGPCAPPRTDLRPCDTSVCGVERAGVEPCNGPCGPTRAAPQPCTGDACGQVRPNVQPCQGACGPVHAAVDDCAGACAPNRGSPPPAPSPVPGATPSSSSGAPSCSPRPAVTVDVQRRNGTLVATVSTTGSGNTLRGVRFDGLMGVSIDVGSQTNQTAPFAAKLPDGPGVSSIQFTVRRTAGASSGLVRLKVTDACGEWPTIVGGGIDSW